MSNPLFAIIDVETTGGQASSDKITEIAIVLHDGKQIVEQYSTLINPNRSIPIGITRLTGISDEMVKDAPQFYEVAKKIVQMTEGAIFVAHNVRFDYQFIREEFKRLGYTYTRKQLCTVKLSRQHFPGLASYSLGNLIKHFNIKTANRHRALDDALATTIVFEKILDIKAGLSQSFNHLGVELKETKLPVGITLEFISQLPDRIGVYYLHDDTGNVIYVGKSINIQKRIIEHFSDHTDKSNRLQHLVHDITYQVLDSELIALIVEDNEIKKLKPTVNKLQKRKYFPYSIHSYYDEKGYLRFDLAKNTVTNRNKLNLIADFPKIPAAREKLKFLIYQFELCSVLAGIDFSKSTCFNYQIKKCKGACCGQEPPEEYNVRATLAEEKLKILLDGSFLVVESCENDTDLAVVLIENGMFSGFGFADKSESQLTSLMDSIKKQPYNSDLQKIIFHYITSNKSKLNILPLPSQE